MVSAYFESYIEFGRTDKIQRMAGSEGLGYAWASLSDDAITWSCVLRSSDITDLITGENLDNMDNNRGVIFDSTSDYDYVPGEDLGFINAYINA